MKRIWIEDERPEGGQLHGYYEPSAYTEEYILAADIPMTAKEFRAIADEMGFMAHKYRSGWHSVMGLKLNKLADALEEGQGDD